MLQFPPSTKQRLVKIAVTIRQDQVEQMPQQRRSEIIRLALDHYFQLLVEQQATQK